MIIISLMKYPCSVPLGGAYIYKYKNYLCQNILETRNQHEAADNRTQKKEQAIDKTS